MLSKDAGVFCFWFCLLVFFLAVLRFELGVWRLRQVLYHLTTTPALFSLVILETDSPLLLRPGWTSILLFYTSCHHWDDRHIPPCPAFFHWRWGFTNSSGMEPQPFQSQPPYRCVPPCPSIGWDPLDLSLPSSKDYMHELPLAPM
jgi:hypothetical protein